MEAATDPQRSRHRRFRKQRKEIQDHATTISELPSHITPDILSGLPLKSIFICKRVCSSFRNLTLDPYFPQLHLPRSPLCLILYRSSFRAYFGFLPLPDSLVDLCRRGATMKFESPIESSGTRLTVVNSCNGLICLSDSYCQNNVYICNPITRQHLRLPESKNEPSVKFQRYCFRYGLGYSRSADHFKVLKFTADSQLPCERYCGIYTLGVDDEWRTLADAGLPFPYNCPFVFFNGALHWIGWENSFLQLLCYFDMEKEQFRSLPLPFQFAGFVFHLGVVDNCLYAGNKTTPSGPVKIWVMKDYGNIGSWTLEWIIQRPLPLGLDQNFKLIKTLKDGTVLMIDENKTLASYNPVSRVLEKIRYHGVHDWNEAIVGLPSFLPLPGAI